MLSCQRDRLTGLTLGSNATGWPQTLTDVLGSVSLLPSRARKDVDHTVRAEPAFNPRVRSSCSVWVMDLGWCPRTAVNSQRPPPAATCEPEARAGFELASNAWEQARNA